MHAKPLATRLKSEFPIGSVTEPSSLQPGKIVISDAVHVRVPLDNSFPCVVTRQADGSFVALDSKSSFPALVKDIKDALSRVSKFGEKSKDSRLR